MTDELLELADWLTAAECTHQRFLLAQQLAHLEALDELIDRVNAEVQERMRPFGAV
jgi:hypothetical protein